MSVSADDIRRARRMAKGDPDLESAACMALAKAAATYDGRGTWSGYSGQRMAWAIVDEQRKRKDIPIGASEEFAAAGIAATSDRAGMGGLDWEALPDNVVEAINGLPVGLRAALLDGQPDLRRTDYKAAVQAVRKALGVGVGVA